jgi:hypothetical protein
MPFPLAPEISKQSDKPETTTKKVTRDDRMASLPGNKRDIMEELRNTLTVRLLSAKLIQALRLCLELFSVANNALLHLMNFVFLTWKKK